VNKELEYYMGLNYKVEIVPDIEGGFALRCPELPGCATCADTVSDGLDMLKDAKREWIAACIEDGITVPEPDSLDLYSGEFKLRIPKSLHKSLAEKSKAEGISMNQYCLYLLSNRYGQSAYK
jgi:predicted RNase H-like HicB family nuclease